MAKIETSTVGMEAVVGEEYKTKEKGKEVQQGVGEVVGRGLKVF